MVDQDAQGINFTRIDDETLQALLEAALKGATVAQLADMSPETLEGLYALGYNLYNSGNYQDAETVFRALCLYDHHSYKYWMGFAGCLQARGEYKTAIDAYSLAGIAKTLEDPQPFLFGAICYLKMNDRDNAKGALLGILDLCADDLRHATCKARAQEMLNLLEGQEVHA